MLLAVHIADGILAANWWIGGCVTAAALFLLGAWGLREEEIPRIALITAVFFVASQIHVPLPPSSAHLLLNGLVGVVLARRALVAIPIGLLLQALLFGHGGIATLGVNSCVLAIPAVVAWAVFASLRALPWAIHPLSRALLVAAAVTVWIFCLVYGVLLLIGVPLAEITVAAHAAILAAGLLIGIIGAWLERRLEPAPEFAIGLCVGEIAVLGSLGLYCVAIVYGGLEQPVNRAVVVEADRLGVPAPGQEGGQQHRGWRTLAMVILLVHLPIAALEALILGFLVGFLAKASPQLIGGVREDKPACATHAA